MRIAFCSFLLMTSCAGSGTVWTPPIQDDLDASYTSCDTSPDCAVVELGCCDHCNGGAAVAVNLDSVGTVVDELGESCGPNVACTEMGCAPLTSECQGNTCVMIQGEL